ncbi:MAG: HAMP domain-containing histidine kinase [Propionibacteriaceae bacterium]|jgi:signal transduction histidine kinase|nr:HAMP domain-containing histidine kinase [Propionibacteriaceae bacterium]
MKARWSGLATRIVVTTGIVIFVEALVAAATALLIGPSLFQQHMIAAGLEDDPAALSHAEEAFRSTNTVAVAVAVACSMVIAVIVSILLARRMSGSLRDLFTAASRTSRGVFDTRVEIPNLGSEFDQVAEAFNELSDALQASRTMRKRLLADVAHELRTPIATIRAILESVEDGIKDLNADTLATLNLHLDRITRLSEDISAVSRAEDPNLELDTCVTSVDLLIEDAVRAAADKYASAQVTLISSIPDVVPRVVADRQRIGQVLGNLLDNALRHTTPGDTVKIAAHDDRAAGQVSVTVADNGDGIAAEHLPNIFDRFYRVDNARDRDHGGSGIGLSIVKALTQAHQGTVEAHSDGLGHGATITIRLPAAPAASGTDKPDPRD